MRRFNFWQMWFWIALIPVAHLTGLVESTAFISDISLIALVLAAQASWQSSRVEQRQKDAENSPAGGQQQQTTETVPETTDPKREQTHD